MNIFFTSHNPEICAKNQCDKHVVKMSVEYAQLLSTSHRVLDGIQYTRKSINNRNLQAWKLDDSREAVIYKASHINHPCNIWLRKSKLHYDWLYKMWIFTLIEYTLRYQKNHKGCLLIDILENAPVNIPNNSWEDPPAAMPSEYKVKDNVTQSYINFYNGAKSSFATWKNNNIPYWFSGEFDAVI